MKKFILACILFGALFSFAACTDPADEPKTPTVQSNSESEGEVQDCRVKIVSAEKGEDPLGDPVLIVTFEWSNNSDSNKMFGSVFSAAAFQGGVECSENVLVEDIDITKQFSEVKPGVTTQLSIAYNLGDNSDVTVEVGPLLSLNERVVATKTFSLE